MTRLSRLLTGFSFAALLGASAVAALAETPTAPPVAAAAQATDAFTYQDMITANRLGDPQVSPDGRWLVYSVTTTDVAANRRAGALYMMDLQNGGGGRESQAAMGNLNTQLGVFFQGDPTAYRVPYGRETTP